MTHTQVQRGCQGAEQLKGLHFAAARLRQHPPAVPALAQGGPQGLRVRHRLLAGENHRFGRHRSSCPKRPGRRPSVPRKLQVEERRLREKLAAQLREDFKGRPEVSDSKAMEQLITPPSRRRGRRTKAIWVSSGARLRHQSLGMPLLWERPGLLPGRVRSGRGDDATCCGQPMRRSHDLKLLAAAGADAP